MFKSVDILHFLSWVVAANTRVVTTRIGYTDVRTVIRQERGERMSNNEITTITELRSAIRAARHIDIMITFGDFSYPMKVSRKYANELCDAFRNSEVPCENTPEHWNLPNGRYAVTQRDGLILQIGS